MSVLVPHRNVAFKNQVVYATGHAYEGCSFEACTIVLQGFEHGVFNRCSFNGCAWHVNVIVHDADMWDNFIAGTASIITKSLPRAP